MTGIIAAEFIRLRDGLLTIVEGGWDCWKADFNPFSVPLPLLVEIETGTIEPGTILDLKFVVRSPDGFQTYDKRQAIMALDSWSDGPASPLVWSCRGLSQGCGEFKFLPELT